MTPNFVFIGERPSRKAHRIGATWQNGKLSAKNLREALEAAGIEPARQVYLNLWEGPEPHENDAADEDRACDIVRDLLARGTVAVGMGQKVGRALSRRGIPHRTLVHPAARGRIRKTELYQAHVRSTLQPDMADTKDTPWNPVAKTA